MVNPILIIVITLISAFSMGIFKFFGKYAVRSLFFATLLFDLTASVSVLINFLRKLIAGEALKPIIVKIGGFAPPIGINLSIDVFGTALATLIYAIGIIAAIHWMKMGFKESETKSLILMMLLLLGATGIIFTGDFFNLFVFIEITSIASYALVASDLNKSSLEASFKYLVIGSISSTLILLGAVFLYKFTGSLNMAEISNVISSNPYGGAILLVAVMFLFGLLIELEVFPMNGWALDIYQGAPAVIVAVIAGVIVKAYYLVFLRSTSLLHFPYTVQIGLIFGLTTYIISQFFAWKQNDIRRLFGYSSISQLGLLILAGTFYVGGNLQGHAKTYLLLSIIFFILNHSFSKSGLFFLADIVGENKIENWKSVFAKNKTFKFLFSTSVLSISGSPPFLGFWAKLFLILALPVSYFYVILIILIGGVAEIVYYFKLFEILDSLKGKAVKLKGSLLSPIITVTFLILLALGGGYSFFHFTAIPVNLKIIAGLAVSVGLIIFWFSRLIQWMGSVIILSYAAYTFLGSEMTLQVFFLYLILAGGLLFTIATFPLSKTYKKTFYPLLMTVIISMAGIVLSGEWISFFIFWELMSWASYLIIYQGKYAKRSSWIYLVMSSIGGYAMLAGIKLLSTNAYLIPQFTDKAQLYGVLAPILIFTAFLIKMATAPLHIWARDAYGESPDGFTPVLSAIMSKIGVFGVIITVAHLLKFSSGSNVVLYGLAWLGTLTAFFMTLLAVFQEDAKKVLAYSSIGQVGYILIGIALSTSLGYSAALYHTANHLIFKGLLFVAIAGIIYRTGTSKLPELGGLIKRMPFTFFAFLLGIITLAGIPPLSGFAGKWLLYSGMLEKRWMFMLLIAMLASVIAFLYCFKLLHTIFLGQLRPKFKKIKKAPLPIMIVELVFAVLTMLIGIKPSILLKAGEKILPSLGFSDPGYTYAGTSRIVSSIGHWNAAALMIFTGGTFVIALVVFFLNNPKIRKVGQLDIGYSGEVPKTPDQVHLGYDLYAHFRRTVRFLIKPVAEKIYSSVYESLMSIVDFLRKFYSGDLNTYALWIIITATFAFYIFYKGV